MDNVLKAAINVAQTIKYYGDTPDHFPAQNKIEGQCGDYAILFALTTGASLVIQNQTSDFVNYILPDGIYKIKERFLPEESFLALNLQYSGFYSWNGVMFHFHPVLGAYTIELVEEKKVVSHFGVDMTSSSPIQTHVWNELNGVVIDCCWATVFDMPFIGEDR